MSIKSENFESVGLIIIFFVVLINIIIYATLIEILTENIFVLVLVLTFLVYIGQIKKKIV